MSSDGDLRVTVRPVSSLLPHEETMPDHVEWVARSISEGGVQKDPVIIDKDTGAVLDGMHRLAAFTKLGLENVVCCSVAYSSPKISLHRWARVYETKGSAVDDALTGLGLTRRDGVAESFAALEKKQISVLGCAGDQTFSRADSGDLQAGVSVVRSLDALAASLGWKRTFLPEDDVDVAINSGNNLVVLLQRLRKSDVVEAAVSGKLFPCKTSLHVIEDRPVAVNFPVADLGKDAGTRLRDRMSRSRSSRLPPNSVYDGRRYKESLLLIDAN